MSEDHKVAQKRHLAKTLTWRIIATTTTFLLAWIFTGDIEAATAIGGTEFFAKMALYYMHERAWYKYVNFDRS